MRSFYFPGARSRPFQQLLLGAKKFHPSTCVVQPTADKTTTGTSVYTVIFAWNTTG